ncbi:hypothetical protein RRG08_062334 [Elysia crispata]|uniref:Uncharacterized protein n=1 Tax=Elysia crispata TaxID=231223 RepID=A0AAE0YGZ5_9GAST|nr:hypothetical protein RRG08_062334 [Elysia crispata]
MDVPASFCYRLNFQEDCFLSPPPPTPLHHRNLFVWSQMTIGQSSSPELDSPGTLLIPLYSQWIVPRGIPGSSGTRDQRRTP